MGVPVTPIGRKGLPTSASKNGPMATPAPKLGSRPHYRSYEEVQRYEKSIGSAKSGPQAAKYALIFSRLYEEVGHLTTALERQELYCRLKEDAEGMSRLADLHLKLGNLSDALQARMTALNLGQSSSLEPTLQLAYRILTSGEITDEKRNSATSNVELLVYQAKAVKKLSPEANAALERLETSLANHDQHSVSPTMFASIASILGCTWDEENDCELATVNSPAILKFIDSHSADDSHGENFKKLVETVLKSKGAFFLTDPTWRGLERCLVAARLLKGALNAKDYDQATVSNIGLVALLSIDRAAMVHHWTEPQEVGFEIVIDDYVEILKRMNDVIGWSAIIVEFECRLAMHVAIRTVVLTKTSTVVQGAAAFLKSLAKVDSGLLSGVSLDYAWEEFQDARRSYCIQYALQVSAPAGDSLSVGEAMKKFRAYVDDPTMCKALDICKSLENTEDQVWSVTDKGFVENLTLFDSANMGITPLDLSYHVWAATHYSKLKALPRTRSLLKYIFPAVASHSNYLDRASSDDVSIDDLEAFLWTSLHDICDKEETSEVHPVALPTRVQQFWSCIVEQHILDGQAIPMRDAIVKSELLRIRCLTSDNTEVSPSSIWVSRFFIQRARRLRNAGDPEDSEPFRRFGWHLALRLLRIRPRLLAEEVEPFMKFLEDDASVKGVKSPDHYYDFSDDLRVFKSARQPAPAPSPSRLTSPNTVAVAAPTKETGSYQEGLKLDFPSQTPGSKPVFGVPQAQPAPPAETTPQIAAQPAQPVQTTFGANAGNFSFGGTPMGQKPPQPGTGTGQPTEFGQQPVRPADQQQPAAVPTTRPGMFNIPPQAAGTTPTFTMPQASGNTFTFGQPSKPLFGDDVVIDDDEEEDEDKDFYADSDEDEDDDYYDEEDEDEEDDDEIDEEDEDVDDEDTGARAGGFTFGSPSSKPIFGGQSTTSTGLFSAKNDQGGQLFGGGATGGSIFGAPPKSGGFAFGSAAGQTSGAPATAQPIGMSFGGGVSQGFAAVNATKSNGKIPLASTGQVGFSFAELAKKNEEHKNNPPPAQPVQKSDDEGDDDDGLEYEPDVEFEPVVKLDKVETRTGEEDEEVLWSVEKAKLFRYAAEDKQWKERGIGPAKILRDPRSQRIRFVMRRDQVFKVCANHAISPGMSVSQMGPDPSRMTWLTTADIADGEPEKQVFMLRFKTEEDGTIFKDTFEKCAKGETVPSQSPSKSSSETATDAKAAPATLSESKPLQTEGQGFSFGGAGSGTAKPFSFADMAKSTASGAAWSAPSGGGLSGLTGSPKPIFGGSSVPSAECEQGGVDDDKADDYEPDVEFEPVVKLDKVEVKTGEEGEDIFFKVDRAKLYRLDKEEKQWKDRGVGPAKILWNPMTKKTRFVMRRDQVFKLCANHSIVAGMSLNSVDGQKTRWQWVAMGDISDGAPEDEMFMIRFKKDEDGEAFKKAFDDCVAGKPTVLESGATDLGREGCVFSKDDVQDLEKSTVPAVVRKNIMDQNDGGLNSIADEAVKASASNLSGTGAIAPNLTTSQLSMSDVDKAPKRISSDLEITYQRSLNTSNPTHVENVKQYQLPACFYCYEDEDAAKTAHISLLDEEDGQDLSSYRTVELVEPVHVSSSVATPSAVGTKTSMFGQTSASGSPFGAASSNQGGEFSFASLAKSAGDNASPFATSNASPFANTNASPLAKSNAPMFGGPPAQAPTGGGDDDKAEDYEPDVEFEPVVKLEKVEKEEDGEAFKKAFDDCVAGNPMVIEKASESAGSIPSTSQPASPPKVAPKTPEAQPKEDESTSEQDQTVPEATASSPVKEASETVSSTSKTQASPAAAFTFGSGAAGSAAGGGFSFADLAKSSNNPPAANPFGAASSGEGFNFAALAAKKGTDSGASWSSKPGEGGLFGQKNAGEVKPLFEGAVTSAGSNEREAKDGAGENTEGQERDYVEDYEPEVEFKPVVQLDKVETVTGEEDEEVLWECDRVKLFRMDPEEKQWKERGIGPARILQDPVSTRKRFIMRRDVVHKLGANHAINGSMKLENVPSNNKLFTWMTAADISDSPMGEHTIFMIRFRKDEDAESFKKAFDAAVADSPQPAKGPQ
eukprot:Clim_evm65s142 gene=Clim_evmTU65s142